MALGFEIDFKRLLAELKNGPMASRDQETLEIERSER